MIVVAATIGFASRHARDAAVAASIEVQRATRDQEPGCMAYCFGADPVDDEMVQVYELWGDEAALAAHFEHPNHLAMRGILRSFERSGPAISTKFRCEQSEPVYDADGIPRADFGGGR